MTTSTIKPIPTSVPLAERVYANLGNSPLIDLLETGYRQVLDVGCGAGDNAALIKAIAPASEVFGITRSASEAALAQAYMVDCWVADIESEIPAELTYKPIDVLIFSHVLEHLRDPAETLSRYATLLRKGGQVLIAIPNVLNWAMRLQFLKGDFRYQSQGILDDTHLHFYTYFTADQLLLSKASDLELTHKKAPGSVPLWVLRRHIFPKKISSYIDQVGSEHWPNLFGRQIVMRAVKR